MTRSSTFDFDRDLRRIALAQALRIVDPDRLDDPIDRVLAYAVAGHCPVDPADDTDAVRRHRLRLSACATQATSKRVSA